MEVKICNFLFTLTLPDNLVLQNNLTIDEAILNLTGQRVSDRTKRGHTSLQEMHFHRNIKCQNNKRIYETFRAYQ